MDGRFIEMMDTAKVMVESCMQVKKGEQVLILTDWYYQECLGGKALQDAIIAALNATDAEVLTLFMKARQGHGELPAIVSKAMKMADVVITVPTEGITHTMALKEALAAGTRVLMMPCAGEVKQHDEIIYKMMPKSKEEIEELAALSLKVEEVVLNAKEIRLTTELGTDLSMTVGTLSGWGACTGVLTPGRAQHIPTGQLAFGVDYGSANGVFVVDGSISPMGRPLNEPVTFEVKDGYIVSISGGADAEYYRSLMESVGDPDVFNIAEVGFGTNPKGRITGHPLGDERLYGSAHIGIGSNAAFTGGKIVAGWWHEDATFSKVTAYADGKMFIDKGEFLV